MKTWEDFKKKAKAHSGQTKEDIEEMEALSSIISAIVLRRKELGLSQRKIASICGLPQSSVARIESAVVCPSLATVLRIMKPLGLAFEVIRVRP